MMYTQFGDSPLFSVHSDDAPTAYVNGTSAQPIRDQTDPIVRQLGRWVSSAGSTRTRVLGGSADVARAPGDADPAGRRLQTAERALTSTRRTT
jgi:hypothetical protein